MPIEAAERAEDIEQPVEEPKPNTIDLTEDDDDEGQEAQPELDKRGRRAHYRELKKHSAEQGKQLEELKRELQELRNQRQAPPREEPRAQPGDPPELAPIRARLAELDSIEDSLMSMAGNQDLTPDQRKDLQRRYRAAQNERAALVADGRAIMRERNRPQVDHAQEAMGAMLRAEFPEIYASDGLKGLAQYQFELLVRQGKDPRNLETHREALRRTRTQAGIGQSRPAPTDADRARYASVPSRAGAAGSSSGGWTPTAEQIRTARPWAKAMGYDVDDNEAARLWALKVGRPNKLL